MKILITQDTFAPSMDGPVHLPAMSLAEMDTDMARAVVTAGKGLYIEPKDDPTTRGNATGRWTASEAQVSFAREAVAAAGRKTVPPKPGPGTTT